MTIPTDEAVERVAKAIRDQNRIHMQRNNPSRTFTRDELTEDETQLARAAIAAMQPSVAAVEPDFCYDPCEWEYTHPWAERNDMMDGWYGTPLKVETLHKGAPKWGVEVALDTDGDGEEDDWEFQWFDSEEAAIHALAKREPPMTAKPDTTPMRDKLAEIIQYADAYDDPKSYGKPDHRRPARYGSDKRDASPNAKNRAPLQDAGYLYRSYDLRQWSGSRLCRILSRNHTTRRQPNQ